MRADAQRNYDRIVEVAREVFREQGYDASLDEVAKRAGVGPGTLYRHFPTPRRPHRRDHAELGRPGRRGRRQGARPRGLAARRCSLALVRGVRRADQPAQGRSGQDHLGDGRPRLPDPHQVPGAQGASDRVLDRLRARTPCATASTPLQVARLVGGVATVADQGDLDAAAVRPMLEVVADGLLV